MASQGISEEIINLIKSEKKIFPREDLLDKKKQWEEDPRILWLGEKLPAILDHGLQHSLNLWGLLLELYKAIPKLKKEEFNSYEIYWLCLSIWLHDIGHRGSEIYGDPPQVRLKHGIISDILLRADPEFYGLTYEDAIVVGTISKFHQSIAPLSKKDCSTIKDKNGYIEKEYHRYQLITEEVQPLEKVELPESVKTKFEKKDSKRILILCAILRFLDACDFNRNRVGDDNVIESRKKWITREKAFIIDNYYKYYLRQLGQHSGIFKKASQVSEELNKVFKANMDMNKAEKICKELLKLCLEPTKSVYFYTLEKLMITIKYIGFLNSQKDYYKMHSLIDKVHIQKGSGKKIILSYFCNTEKINSKFKKNRNFIKSIKKSIEKEWEFSKKYLKEIGIETCILEFPETKFRKYTLK